MGRVKPEGRVPGPLHHHPALAAERGVGRGDTIHQRGEVGGINTSKVRVGMRVGKIRPEGGLRTWKSEKRPRGSV